MTTLRTLAVLLYSVLVSLATPLLVIVARFHGKLGAQLEGRTRAADLAVELVKERAGKKRCVVFYCSSAGEFEQARPLIDRLAGEKATLVHVVFFSRSGYEFAKARGETLSMSLAPPSDSVWQWGWLFAALRPDVVAVVRHELWPGFLETARNYARLYLIDASKSLGEARSGPKRFVRSTLLKYFDKIFVVDAADHKFFAETYGIEPARLAVTGDTKYDRVVERAHAKAAALPAIRQALGGGEDSTRLVLGSAYREDIEAWLTARKELGEAARGWQTVIVPHHLDPSFIAWILERTRGESLQTALYGTANGVRPDVLVVDKMGLLAEIYGTAALAYVGGALHNQVHNVLEPAVRGLGLAFGPKHANSAEAVQLATAGTADVVADGAGLAAWWRKQAALDGKEREAKRQAITSFGGATDRILTAWQADLGGAHAR